GAALDELRIFHGGGIDADLVRARIQERPHVVLAPDAPADSERDECRLSRFGDDIEQRAAALVRRGDIQERDFVGAVFVIACRTFDRVAGVAQADEADAFDDPPPHHVQTRDDAPCEHQRVSGCWPRVSYATRSFSMEPTLLSIASCTMLFIVALEPFSAS